MHNLEHLLLLLSQRLKQAGQEELADAAETLASASHDYDPIEGADEKLADMNADWTRRFGPKSSWVYVIKDPSTGYLKIGRSNNPERRRNHFQTATPQVLEIVHTHHATGELDADDIEARLHRMLSAQRVTGEWFNVTLDQVKAALEEVLRDDET